MISATQSVSLSCAVKSRRTRSGAFSSVFERHVVRTALLRDTPQIEAMRIRRATHFNPARIGNSINVRLDGPNGTRIIWEVGDPIDRDGWSSTRIEMIQRLLPHIRQYVSVRHVLSGAEALGASLAELLENTMQGIIQLDWRGRIVATNDRAMDLLRTADGLLDNDGYLFAHHSADNTDLQKLLKDALPPYGQQCASGSMTVRRLATFQPLVLHVNPVNQRQADCRSWPVAALVLVVDPRSDTRIDPDLVAQSLGLTPMESRVAVMMAEGKAVR